MAQDQQQYPGIEAASEQPNEQPNEKPNAESREEVSTEEKIRTRAYYLWERATDPKGHPDEYWEQARAEIEKEAPQQDSKDGKSKKGVLPTPTAKEKP
ncbi:DUF2934 domain-containing protein [Paraburkholderia phenazinium]|jgi:hypothetical protein|uniref:DUF2934 family protein n=1 Tax=Paraburkholderia phenazinium TaxID=60549 RepID=A0A1G7UBI9_9BURK|nr:DUF2934 domain-containing protein [Paraburkholderia phenazinium]SDG44942.1 Protein of unknown function [Paraburkholderia phenazinium]